MQKTNATPPIDSKNWLSLDKAQGIIKRRLHATAKTEYSQLSNATGRITAEALLSQSPLPPFDNAAVDGFAVAVSSLHDDKETTLPLYGQGLIHKAGDMPPATLPHGLSLRIMTGAAMPQGADTILPQELCTLDEANNLVTCPPKPFCGANRRLIGEDVQRGDIIIPRGKRLRPQDIALAAAAGHHQLLVYKKLPVALFSTGNELIEPTTKPAHLGLIHDANRYGIQSLLSHWDANCHDMGILKDEPSIISQALQREAKKVALIVTSGGISTGASDVIAHHLQQHGEFAFWRLAIKPGRPIGFGFIDETPIVALPGNPVAALVTAMILLRDIFFIIQGRDNNDKDIQPFFLPSAFDMTKKAGRREYLRASRKDDGTLDRYPKSGAGILTSLTTADGLLILEEEQTNIQKGDPLSFIPFSSYLW